jgi:hypothetical protein
VQGSEFRSQGLGFVIYLECRVQELGFRAQGSPPSRRVCSLVTADARNTKANMQRPTKAVNAISFVFSKV